MNEIQPIREGYPLRKLAYRDHPWLLLKSEWRVVEAICAGHDTNKRVGDFLSISPRTVQTHMMNILGKIGVSTKAALILAVINDGAARKRCFPHLP